MDKEVLVSSETVYIWFRLSFSDEYITLTRKGINDKNLEKTFSTPESAYAEMRKSRWGKVGYCFTLVASLVESK